MAEDHQVNTNNQSNVSKPAPPRPTRITCASCGGIGSKWNGTIMEPCNWCNGKGYIT
jgi:DnaJ-class molecular chaperone